MLQRALRLPKQLIDIWRHPLNRGARGAAIGRWLRWQIVSRFARDPTQVPFIGKTCLVARPGEAGITGNIYYGLAEYQDMAFALHLLRPGDLFVDVGANAGAYTVLASGVAGAFTEAFEPIPSAADRLEYNIGANALENLVRVHRVGIGSTVGTLRFTLTADTMNHVTFQNEPAEEMPVETLDRMLAFKQPTLIKIDVEGFEPEVVAGAKEILTAISLLAVIVEINSSYEHYGRRLADLIDPLSDAGFTPYAYEPSTRSLVELSGSNPTSGNTIFIRNKTAVEDRLATAPDIRIRGNSV